ncbi:MAG: nucleotidyl transferase AbiEii/AbiGii toxin family protein [Anaerolineae bacterium]|nr:nucleotidyl transferase AbiEii/AbiGii toxin family protein [Anaerolineae bacterium]
MIPETELRNLARRLDVDLMLLDLDYSLGCFLAGLGQQNLAGLLCFKGATCLRKCYFPDYRFSEDLDFTAQGRLTEVALKTIAERAVRWVEREIGLDFTAAPIRVRTISDEYGKESFEVRLYYRGPLSRTGSPRAVRLDVTRDETLIFPCEARSILHPFSDQSQVAATLIPTYSLQEILAEKIRAIAGQRRFAISRDLYDIHQLLERGVDLSAVLPILPIKFEVKGLHIENVHVSDLEARRPEFEADWRRRLTYLLPRSQSASFEDAWEAAIQIIKQIGE